IQRWARVGLPNGQIARSVMKEAKKSLDTVRMARNVKIQANDALVIAEVQYYFQLNINNSLTTLALVSKYSAPDAALLEISHKTLYSCTYHGFASLAVYDAKEIVSVVAMVP
ncbi:hypothetical protein SISSUDRAFT_966440, partial [Sistotremastrum suecicum HHB10207 ss-3]